jgi:hypothetical protein
VVVMLPWLQAEPARTEEEENYHEEEDCQAKGWRKTVTMKEEDCPTEPEHALD